MSMRYDLEEIQVLVTWEEFLPNGKEPSPEKTVLFFAGWPLKEAPVKGMRRIGEEFANNSGARTYVIYTKGDRVVTEPSYHHALAVCKFLSEKKIKRIILAGNSQGGLKAIDTIIRLQELSLDIQIEGLILINSSGLNNISGWTFLRRQIVDITIKTWLMILRESAREPSFRKKIISLRENVAILNSGTHDYLFAIWKDIRPSLRAFLSGFINEVIEGTTRSPYLDQISVPIVIIQGAKDRSLDNDRVLIQAKYSPIFSKNAKKQISVEDLFPCSPYVRLLRIQKYGHHLLLFFRTRSIAKVSLHLLKNYNKETR